MTGNSSRPRRQLGIIEYYRVQPKRNLGYCLRTPHRPLPFLDPLQCTEIMNCDFDQKTQFRIQTGTENKVLVFSQIVLHCFEMLVSLYIFEAVSSVSHIRRSEKVFADRRLTAVASLCELVAATCVCDRAACRCHISLRAACSYMCLRLGSQPLSHLLVSCLQLHVFAFGRLAADASLFEVHA